jgi:hypothetical protein
VIVAAAENSAAATRDELDASRAANSADLARKAADGSVPQPMRLERGPFAGCAKVLGNNAARAMINELKRAMVIALERLLDDYVDLNFLYVYLPIKVVQRKVLILERFPQSRNLGYFLAVIDFERCLNRLCKLQVSLLGSLDMEAGSDCYSGAMRAKRLKMAGYLLHFRSN